MNWWLRWSIGYCAKKKIYHTIKYGEKDGQSGLGLWHTNRSPYPSQTTSESQQQPQEKKITYWIVDLDVPHAIKQN